MLAIVEAVQERAYPSWRKELLLRPMNLHGEQFQAQVSLDGNIGARLLAEQTTQFLIRDEQSGASREDDVGDPSWRG